MGLRSIHLSLDPGLNQLNRRNTQFIRRVVNIKKIISKMLKMQHREDKMLAKNRFVISSSIRSYIRKVVPKDGGWCFTTRLHLAKYRVTLHKGNKLLWVWSADLVLVVKGKHLSECTYF